MKNRNGFALTEILMTGTIGTLLFLAYHSNITSISRVTNNLTEKVIAQNYASETIEMFRGLTLEQMTDYLERVKESLPLCRLRPGDFDRDGEVTPADLHILQNSPTIGWKLPADANFDGKVDIADYNIPMANRDMEPTCGLPNCPAHTTDKSHASYTKKQPAVHFYRIRI